MNHAWVLLKRSRVQFMGTSSPEAWKQLHQNMEVDCYLECEYRVSVAWCTKCTWVQDYTTNVKAEWWGVERRGNRPQALCEAIVPNIKTVLHLVLYGRDEQARLSSNIYNTGMRVVSNFLSNLYLVFVSNYYTVLQRGTGTPLICNEASSTFSLQTVEC